MARTVGAKDKNRRQRRQMTEREKKRRTEERQRREQRARSTFIASMAAKPAPATNNAEDDTVQEPEAHVADIALDTVVQEPEVHFQEIPVNECNGTTDLGNIAAVLDDESENFNDMTEDSVMKCYLKAIMNRYKTEDSPDFVKNFPNGELWLQAFLRDHGFWIRSECAQLICRNLGIPFCESAYYRHVRIWFPDAEGGKAMCMPACISCKRTTHVRVHSYPTHHPGRRVVTLDSHIFIMSRQYCCVECKKEHERRKSIAELGGQPFERVQYTFMGYHEEVLRRLPDDLKYKFPAFLTHRTGLHMNIVRSLRPLLDKGLRPEGVSEWLLELHSLKFADDYSVHEVSLERDRTLRPNLQKPMFSKFDDQTQYDGRVPSGSYITSVHKTECERIRPGLDREVKKVSVADQISIDASSKAPKKLTQHNGKRMYEALQTITNGIGQIRTQTLAGSDSHEQLEPSLSAMKRTLEEHGKEGPALAFTDNPSRDKQFLLENFASLQRSQEELDRIAAELNAQSKHTDAAAPAALTTADDEQTMAQPQSAANSTAEPLQSGYCRLAPEHFQTVATRDINDKIEALWQETEAPTGRVVYGLDGEWDTVHTGRGEDRRKVGNVALLQISYRHDNVIKALLLQLPKSGPLPHRLVAFLQNQKALFVGVGIRNDIRLLGEDFGLESSFVEQVSFSDLGMMARDRDVVQRGNHRLDYLVELVLGDKLDKSDDVRCSKWSSHKLSNRQMVYAALDVIKPLEMYEELSKLPDLSQRLDPACARHGLMVDIVPPHARKDRRKPARGYRVGDLATRAAIGKIIEDTRTTNPAGITPTHVKVSADTVLVEVTECLAPSVFVPGHHIGRGRRQKACLGDFGTTPFKVVLPLTMLREQVETGVRTYQDPLELALPRRRITPPAPAKPTSPAQLTQAQPRNSDSQPQPEPDTELPQENATSPLDIVNDLLHDEDNNSNDDALDSDLFNLINDDVQGGDDVNEDHEDEQHEDRHVFNRDAGKEVRKEHLESMEEAEMMAELAEKEGKVELLFCDELDAPPDSIAHVFSSVLGDVFHAMNRAKVPVKHEYKKAYFVALMNAFLVWNDERLDEVISKLKENGWTDEEIQTMLYFRPAHFRRRCERIVLSPRQLYWRVRAVFVKFGNKLDSSTGLPLFNKTAWKKANNLLKEILLGLYSDPPGFNFYHLEVDADGSPRTDKHGLQLLHCSRGTNDVENAHKNYNTTFRHIAGIEMGDCLLAERRHRHNIRMAESRIPGYPRLGHYDTWKIDKLQILVEKNHGRLLFPDWVNASDHRDTDESFVTVAIHSEELDKALKERAKEISDEVKKSYTGDLLFQCRALGIDIPFLPVDGEDEYKLFAYLLLSVLKRFDDEEMAMKWIGYVDGVRIFPKYPHQLRKYHKQWERNRRVKNAVENMRSDADMLEALNKEYLPTELAAGRQVLDEDMDASMMLVDENADDEVLVADPPSDGLLNFPQAVLRGPMQQPPLTAMRPAHELDSLYLGMERLGNNPLHFGFLPPLRHTRGMRGQDQVPRKGRSCSLCVENGQCERARQCKGRSRRCRCQYFNEDGSSKAPT